jgi:hypothetical protein
MAFPILMYFPNIVPSPNTFQKLAKNANLKPSTWNSISTWLDIIYLMLPASKEYLHSAKLLFFSTHLRSGTNWRHGMVLKTWFEQCFLFQTKLKNPFTHRFPSTSQNCLK